MQRHRMRSWDSKRQPCSQSKFSLREDCSKIILGTRLQKRIWGSNFYFSLVYFFPLIWTFLKGVKNELHHTFSYLKWSFELLIFQGKLVFDQFYLYTKDVGISYLLFYYFEKQCLCLDFRKEFVYFIVIYCVGF